MAQDTRQSQAHVIVRQQRFADHRSWLPYQFAFTLQGRPAFPVVRQWGCPTPIG